MSADSLIVFPPFRLDAQNQQLWRETALLPLRPKTFAVLLYLATHPGRLVTASELRHAIWPDTYVSEGLLRGYIRELRDILGDDAKQPQYIETVPRRGYRFVAAVSAAPVISSQSSVVSDAEGARGWGLGASSSFPQAPSLKSQVPNLVGRETELRLLHQWLATAATGTRQVAFVTGEPGIGKTTLVDTFLRGAGNWALGSGVLPSPDPKSQSLEPVPRIARGQCLEHYGAAEAYLPVLEALGQLCHQPGGEQIVMLLSRYAPTWLVQMPAFVSDAEFDALQRKVQGATRERMLREMAEALEALTTERPLVLVLEDIHWSDRSTLDLISILAQRRGPARLLLLATYRPTDVVMSGHPLRALKQELQVHRQCEELPLGFLTTSEVTQYINHRFPQHTFPLELGQIIHQSTEGNPLFLVNVVNDWVNHRALMETDGQWHLMLPIENVATGVPESLRQLIAQQVERLMPEELQMLEAASVVGTEFTCAAVAAGLEETQGHVEEWCERLSKRGQFLRARGTETLADGTVTGRYEFLHALYQQVAYEGLTALRRTQLHRRIGRWGEDSYRSQGAEYAAQLAMHFERGQEYARAILYLTKVADNANRRHAYQEEITLLARALELLQFLPDPSERNQQELALQIRLGAPLLMTRGYAALEVEQTYARVQALRQQIGESPQLLPAIAGLFRFYLMRAELTTARELGEQVLRLAEDMKDNTVLLIAHSIMGVPLITLGELLTAREHLEQGIALYHPEHHRFIAALFGDDPGVACRSFVAVALWFLGYPEQALRRNLEAIVLAQELALPYSEAFALSFAAWVHVRRREGNAAQARIAALLALAAEQGFQLWTVEGTVLQGWALAEQGHIEEGIAHMRQGLAAYSAMGAEMGRSGHLALLAEVYGKAGQVEEGLRTLTEAFAAVQKTGEQSHVAELYRLRGELMLQQERQKSKIKRQQSKVPRFQPLAPSTQEDVELEVEACFLKAIAIAQQQEAKSFELRATMSLVRLRRRQAEHATRTTQHVSRDNLAQAHGMLSGIYNWFTEGFDTKDLQEARALIASWRD